MVEDICVDDVRIKRFCELGAAIYGEDWKSPLARTFKTNVRTIRRWASGESEIPENIIIALEIIKNNNKKGQKNDKKK